METHNPTKASCFGSLLGDTPRWTKKRYCREHKASIEGLDHFCTWLNVSVGRQNYVPFYVLSAAGTVQYALRAAIGIGLIGFFGDKEKPSVIEITREPQVGRV